MLKYFFFLWLLLGWTNSIAQSNNRVVDKENTLHAFRSALSLNNDTKQSKAIDEIFLKSAKNGSLFTKEVYNYLFEVNLTEKWSYHCGKVVDNLLLETGLVSASEFMYYLLDQKIPLLVLEKMLIQKIQANPENTNYIELVIQVYISTHQYEKAWIQQRAMDLRLKQMGSKLAEFGQICLQNEQWELALRVFDYLIKSYPSSVQSTRWFQGSLFAKEQILFSGNKTEEQELWTLIRAYRKLRKERGINSLTMDTYLKESHVFSIYLKNIDSAVVVLEKGLLELGNNVDMQSRMKLELANLFSFQGKKYEALIQLAQVEKLSKDSPISYEAKLRRAKIYYYTGDFELAKELLDILKESTQKEIANDALNLRWVIEDNTGIDSLENHLKAFSAIQFLYEQNKIQDADDSLQEFSNRTDKLGLEDDVLFLKANRALSMRNLNEAKTLFYDLWKRFPNDIYADDALYQYLTLINFSDKSLGQLFIQNYPTSLFQSIVRDKLVNPSNSY
jgi:tetratricopeptide (TPR) repeat protein